MNNQDVTIYISDNNKKCDKVIGLMEDYDVSYKLKNVTKNRDYMKELQNSGIYGTPATFIEKGRHTILGFQKNRILKALNLLS